jgi:hypothetical protein
MQVLSQTASSIRPGEVSDFHGGERQPSGILYRVVSQKLIGISEVFTASTTRKMTHRHVFFHLRLPDTHNGFLFYSNPFTEKM